MPVVENSIVINAPMEKVFGILDDPERYPAFFAGVVGISDVSRTEERIGDSGSMKYSVLGIHFDVQFTIQAWEENKAIVSRLEGAFPGKVTTTFNEQDDGVKVTQTFDYTIGGGVLGRALNAVVVERMNERNAQHTLENLKTLCEAE